MSGDNASVFEATQKITFNPHRRPVDYQGARRVGGQASRHCIVGDRMVSNPGRKTCHTPFRSPPGSSEHVQCFHGESAETNKKRENEFAHLNNLRRQTARRICPGLPSIGLDTGHSLREFRSAAADAVYAAADNAANETSHEKSDESPDVSEHAFAMEQ